MCTRGVIRILRQRDSFSKRFNIEPLFLLGPSQLAQFQNFYRRAFSQLEFTLKSCENLLGIILNLRLRYYFADYFADTGEFS